MNFLLFFKALDTCKISIDALVEEAIEVYKSTESKNSEISDDSVFGGDEDKDVVPSVVVEGIDTDDVTGQGNFDGGKNELFLEVECI